MSVVTLGGLAVASGDLYIPRRGAWFAQLVLTGTDVPPNGTIKIADAEWRGTVGAESGVFGGQWTGHIVGGAGRWSLGLPRKGYHNDGGVKPALVARDLARECGETLGTISPGSSVLGNDYARSARAASETLEDIARGVPWWVGRDGVTHIAARSGPALTLADVLEYDAQQRRLEFVLDDLRLVDIGSVISSALLPSPITVGALDINISSGAIRCVAWEDAESDPLADALMLFNRKAASERLHGVYRYRVVSMADRRVNLQAVTAAAGVPDLLAVSQWPGVAGVHANLLPGGQVLVQFVAGDRGDPVITQYVGNHEAVPPQLEIGGPGGAPANAQGDAVEVLMPPAVFSGTIGGTPATGVLTFPAMKALGVTTGGHPKVRIGP